jgi:hypothetical protein
MQSWNTKQITIFKLRTFKLLKVFIPGRYNNLFITILDNKYIPRSVEKYLGSSFMASNSYLYCILPAI